MERDARTYIQQPVQINKGEWTIMRVPTEETIEQTYRLNAAITSESIRKRVLKQISTRNGKANGQISKDE